MIIKTLFISLVSLLSFSCLEESNESVYQSKSLLEEEVTLVVSDSTQSELNFRIKDFYRNEKRKIEKLRLSLMQTYSLITDSLKEEQFLDSTSLVFTKLLLNNILPHWYGTPWEFEGHTSIPNQGEIACGYFVSTTLNHMGLNLNRYHLARKGPLNEAKSIAIDSNLVIVFNSEESTIKDSFFTSFADGLYFVGLDSHVGFLYVHNNHAFFLHSNYIENRVMLEPIENSAAFESYTYILVKITNNRLLLKSWLLGTSINVYKN